MEERVILVNEKDEPIGTMPKLEAHQKGLLHRAFSIFIRNDAGELLLQQRAAHKYHSPGLWTNTCCSHQRENETTGQAAKRRLREEMGIETELEELFSFRYKASFENGLTEHEYDHVLLGVYNGIPAINLHEVAAWKWMPLEEVKKAIQQQPERYTIWFVLIFDRFYQHMSQQFK